jgi:hypothetical protein
VQRSVGAGNEESERKEGIGHSGDSFFLGNFPSFFTGTMCTDGNHRLGGVPDGAIGLLGPEVTKKFSGEFGAPSLLGIREYSTIKQVVVWFDPTRFYSL